MNHFITFDDGQKIELTDIQYNEIYKKVTVETKPNPFEYSPDNKIYYSIVSNGEVVTRAHSSCREEKECYNVGNYCTNKELMKQRALHEILDRLLWRFRMINGGTMNWDSCEYHYYIIHDPTVNHKFQILDYRWTKYGCTWFDSSEIAQRAIDEIIMPFMKEHPEFIW